MLRSMDDDAQYLEQRRNAEIRDFLVNSMDDEIAPRIAPAMRALHDLLAAHPLTRYTHIKVMATMGRSSDVTTSTIANLVRRLVKGGFIKQYGEYRRSYSRRGGWTGADNRSYSLGDWPSK